MFLRALEGESWDEQLRFTISAASTTSGEPDWASVLKQVTKSEPPRILDAPEHIKFCQRWGGGKDMHFLSQTLEYIEGRMLPSRIVSGNFIGKLAALRMEPQDMIPHTVHACLITQAVSPENREDIGTAITVANISSLLTTNKEIGQRVNAAIVRARAVAGQDHASAVQVADMAVQCVRYMFKLDDTFKSIDHIVEQFVNRVTGGTPASASDVAEADATEAPATVEFFASGDNNSGKNTIQNAGFNIDELVEPKKPTNTESQYMIAVINDDGRVGLNPILNDGQVDRGVLTMLSRKNFLNDYRLCRNRKQLHEGYPANIADTSNTTVTEFSIRSAIGVALFKMMAAHPHPVAFRMQSKPSQRVFATGPAKIGGVTLVPMTYKIELLGEKAEVPEPSTASSPVVCSGKTFLLKRCIEAKWVAEYWAMRTVTDLKLSNFKLETIVENVIVSASTTLKISIKCAVNRKALVAGDEAVLYKPMSPEELQAAAAKATPKAGGPAAKRQRH